MYTCMFHTLYVKIFEMANSQIYVEVNSRKKDAEANRTGDDK